MVTLYKYICLNVIIRVLDRITLKLQFCYLANLRYSWRSPSS